MYETVSFQNNGKLKLLIIVGTRPEVIRLSAVIKKCRRYFDTILAHTGQNYDYNLNGVFFRDLELGDPEVYLDAVGADLGETMGNIIAKSYQLMVAIKPDAVLVRWRLVENSRSFDKRKSAHSRWVIYRDYMKLPLHQSLWAFGNYAFASVKKYFLSK